MDASYDDIPLQVQVPVRVFSAKCNPIMSVIYFDFFGKPAQITIPAEKQATMSSGYEILRELLHVLAQNLESKSHFYMAAKYIPIASQIEELLRDFMLDVMTLPSPTLGWLGSYPLEWFLTMTRRQFILTEQGPGRVCAMRENMWPELPPSTEELPPIPLDLPSVSTAHIKVDPSRCGKNRISGSITVDMMGSQIGAHTYTFVCMRELGAYAASEGCLRAMAFQIRQLELIESLCRQLSAEERRVVCVPGIRAYLFYESSAPAAAGKQGRLPVGALFDELPKLMPLRNSNPPLEVLRDCVLKICKTVEWLMDKGIGWGGSAACVATHKGHALLDAIVVDAFGRPWLMEGFTDVVEGKLLSDRISVQSLRLDYGLLGVEQIM